METFAALASGIVLAASTGLRAFMPLFAAGLAARTVGWELAPSMGWLASDASLVVFGAATAVEIVADKVPFVDHALDALHVIVAPVAGALAALSVWLHMPPVIAAVLALIVAAPVAGGVHLVAAGTRVKSTGVSAGALNPVVSLVEDFVAIAAVVVAVIAPVIALLVVVLMTAFVLRLFRRRRVERAA